jgi:hypothetical protein
MYPRTKITYLPLSGWIVMNSILIVVRNYFVLVILKLDDVIIPT